MAGRILIADTVATNRIVLKVRLSSSRYEIVQAANADELLALAREARPDLVIVDAALAGGGGAAACARMKADPRLRALPVLLVDGEPRRATRLAALKAGADDYLAKPVDEAMLAALVRTLMRTRATYDELGRRQETTAALGFAEAGAGFARPARVAVVAPSTDAGLVWRRALGLALPARIAALRPEQALDGIGGDEAPDAYVIAADIATSGDGLRLVSEIRARPAGQHAAIVLVTGRSDLALAPMALDIGASAVVTGRFDPEEVAARLTLLLARKLETDALRENYDRGLSLATRDALTGLYNRRYADAYIRRVAAEAHGSGQPFALMLLDLDRFKAVNDTHGHMVGDRVLVETARRLRANLREIDLVARWGGEEFVVAMPETGLRSAEATAERLRRVVGERPVRVDEGTVSVQVTVSIGVAVCPGGAASPDRLPALMLQHADAALYASKNEGRNQVTLSRGQAA
jgi:two-component system cell cycle response regulator